MDGPVEQPSHTHDQTLILMSLCSLLIAKIIKAFRHNFLPLVVELMGMLQSN